MKSSIRLTAVVVALSALAWSGPQARALGPQGGQVAAAAGGQAAPQQAKPPAQAKPAEQAKPAAKAEEELPADFKAFNAASAEKDVHKKIAALEAFIASHPDSVLVEAAKSQVDSNLRTAFTSARDKYLDSIKRLIEEGKKSETSPVIATYGRIATQLMGAGLLEEADQYARDGLASMNENEFVAFRKKAEQRAAEAARNPKPRPATGYTMSMVGGVMTARPAASSPAAAPKPAATPPAPPPAPTDEQLRTSYRTTRADLQATLGQTLIKRGHLGDGEKILAEAYAARPPAATMATVARLLAGSAKKAGNDKNQLEYLTTLALSGRITAAEREDLLAVYAKTHGGSADGLEEMLDERYRRETPKYVDVPPFSRNPVRNQRVVLAEVFAGAG